MKKGFVFMFLVFNFSIAFGQSINLDTAIKEAAALFTERLPRNSKIAVTSFSAPKNNISEYIIVEMEKHFVNARADNARKFGLVERREIDEARKELNFNMSGEVSDETAQGIGHFVGAQIAVFGSISKVGRTYRMDVRAITVNGAEVEGIYTANVSERGIEEIFGKTDSGKYTKLAHRDSIEYGVNHYIEWNDNYTGFYWEPVSIHWSLLPFTSIGIGAGFGIGKTRDGRDIYKAGITPYAGLVFPITENVRLIGDGFIELGHNGLGNFAGGSATVNPGFDAGLLFSFENGFGFNIRYKGLWTGDSGYINSLGITISENAKEKSFSSNLWRIIGASILGICFTGFVSAANINSGGAFAVYVCSGVLTPFALGIFIGSF
jgi:hypothetical protein